VIETKEEVEREVFETDVLFIGAGPACLAGAIRLQNLVDDYNDDAEADGKDPIQVKIMVLEKGSDVGAHGISGAVLDPRALDELYPGWKEDETFPVERFVERECMLMLSETSGFTIPVLPPEFHDKGKPIISIAKFQTWLAERCEERGIEEFPGTAGNRVLYNDDGQVIGVRTRDLGIAPDGSLRDDFEPGSDFKAKITILGEGPRGHLSRQIFEKFDMLSNNPITYEMGCKEVIELPEGSVKDGFVYLTAGYPLNGSMGPINGTFGGAFLYSMGGDRVAIGLLAVLDAHNPDQDVQYLLQKLKLHPKIREILKGGKVVKYGAKAVTVGGWGCMPKLYAPGAMVVGDSASFLNAARIKGIHLAMKSGMCAAEAAFEALLVGEYGEAQTRRYKELIDASWVRSEMEVSQNFHTHISNNGLPIGAARYGLSKVTTPLFGAGSIAPAHEDHTGMQTLKQFYGSDLSKRPQFTGPSSGQYTDLEYDGEYIINKLDAVYLSGSTHEEIQPSHLVVAPPDPEHCVTKCAEEYGNPCERFCPAQVYNIIDDENAPNGKRLQVDFGNCVHCKTCDVRDPYQVIKWVPPEAGGGPEYHDM
jgi:electron-transferring-flavoprotein dehydrogenase